MYVFRDRVDAGRRLAERLGHLREPRPLVLGLPRGGVVVAAEVARALGAPLDVWVARKLGAPMQPELGMGAIAEGGAVWVDERILGLVGATDEDLRRVIIREQMELKRRIALYRGSRPPPELQDRTAILVDDGIATGGTVRASIRGLRDGGASRIVVAVPVAPPDTIAELTPQVDELVCLEAPERMMAIGGWYEDFSQTTDEDVLALLRA